MISSTFTAGIDGAEDALNIRREVFIEEQGWQQSEESDGFDADALHLAVYVDEDPAASGRIWHDGSRFMIGRIAVRKKYRGQKLGDLAVRLLLFKAFNSGAQTVGIEAQTYIMPLYEKFGFKAHGEEFTKAGRPHFAMSVGKDEVKYPSDCCGR